MNNIIWLASEKTATKMFDNMNLSFEGTRLTFERFSEIAKNDIYVALQLLVDNFDKLSSQQTTLQKMFTARHWTKISALLASMGGNVESFVDSMTTSNDVNEDYEKQLNNLNTQLEQLQGKLKNANSVFMEMTKDIAQQFVPILNVLLDGFSELNNKSLVGISTKATTVGSTLTVLGAVLYNVAKRMDLLNKTTSILKSTLNPYYLLTLTITTALSALYFRMKDVEKARKKEIEYLKEQDKLYKDNISSIETAERQIEAYESALQSLSNVEISDKWSTEIDFIKEAIETTKEYRNLMEVDSFAEQSDKLNYSKKELDIIKERKKTFEDELVLIEMQSKALDRVFPRGSQETKEQNVYKQLKGFLNNHDIEFSYKEITRYLNRINDFVLGGTDFSFEELKKIYDKFDKVALKKKKEDITSILAIVTEEEKTKAEEILVLSGKINEKINEGILQSKKSLAKSSLNIFEQTFKTLEDFETELNKRRSKYKEDTGEELTLFTAYQHMKKSGLDDMMKDMTNEQKVQLINSKEMKDTATTYFSILEGIKNKENEIKDIQSKTVNRRQDVQKQDQEIIKGLETRIAMDKQNMNNLIFKIVYQDKINKKHEETTRKLGKIYRLNDVNFEKEKARIALMDEGIDKLKEESELYKGRLDFLKEEKTALIARVGTREDNLKQLEEYNKKATGIDAITGKPIFSNAQTLQNYNNIVDNIEEIDRYNTKIQNTTANINSNMASQLAYTIAQAKAIQSYYDKLETLKNKQYTIEDKAFMVAGQSRDDIYKKIDQTQQKLLESDELKKQDIILLESQLSYYKRILGYIKDINKEQQEVYSSGLNMINSFTSGQSMTPSFNTGDITSWLSNAEGSDPLKGKAEALNFGITQYNNIMQNTFSQEATNIQQRIDIMKMQQSLLTDEEDIRESQERILREQINLINTQAKAQSQQSIMGGVTSGISSGVGVASGLSSVAGMASMANPIGIAVGAMSIIGGLLGSSSSKKEAKAQQRMLELQAETNRLLEIQNKNTEAMRNFQEEGSRFGTAYAKSGFTYTTSKIDKDTVKTLEETLKFRDELMNKEEMYADEYAKLSKRMEYFSLSEVERKVAYGKDPSIAPTKEEQQRFKDLQEGYTPDIDYELEQVQKSLEGINDSREKYFKEWYGFQIDEEKEHFKLREDILNNYIDNANQSYNNLGEVIANTFTTGYLNSYVKEVMGLDDVLNNLEIGFTNFIDAQISGQGNLTTLLQGNNGLISTIENLELQQRNVNQYTQDFLNIWTASGGKISDVSDLIGYDLYKSISTALDEENYEDTANNLGDSIGKTIGDRMKEQFINANYADEILGLNQKLSEYFNQDALNIRGIQAIGTELQRVSIQAEQYQDRIALINDLMDFSSDVDYQNTQNEITYSTGSTSTNYYNYYISNNATIQDSIGFSEDSANALFNMLTPYIEKYMDNRYA